MSGHQIKLTPLVIQTPTSEAGQYGNLSSLHTYYYITVN